MALSRETLVVIEGRELAFVFSGVVTGEVRTAQVRVLPWRPSGVRLSPSGNFLLLAGGEGRYAAIVEVASGKLAGEIYGPDPIAACFGTLGELDLLICSRASGVLEGLTLPGMEVAFKATFHAPRRFVFDRLCVTGDQTSLGIVGHDWVEPLDRLVVLEIAELIAAPEQANDTLRAAPVIVEGDGLFVGGGEDEVGVLVRSDDVARSDELVICSTPSGRISERRTIERIEDPATQLTSTAEVVAFARDRRVSLYARAGPGGLEESAPAEYFAFDALGPRIVVWSEASGFELITLPG